MSLETGDYLLDIKQKVVINSQLFILNRITAQPLPVNHSYGMIEIMEIVFFLIILVYSIILHEIVHGYVAERLGDSTARYAGRLTLDPRPHIDPFLTILLPIVSFLLGFPFGAAKPVPVNPLNLREGRKDMALVALAGPLTNFAIALFFLIIYKVTDLELFRSPIIFNVWLGILNMVPIPPIDGSKFVSSFLPARIAYQYESIAPFGFMILIFMIYMPIGTLSLGAILNNLLNYALRLFGV